MIPALLIKTINNINALGDAKIFADLTLWIGLNKKNMEWLTAPHCWLN